ncbi:Uma2 family endonuclease [Streptomyces geranii]|uniref:Uma2 family endonuclease n=1 Tax=Streptomyces geranii TaxID=2058923 RepID=UPI001E365A33|nr:Uma2 family endonuclease [Streptomyces geranii]
MTQLEQRRKGAPCPRTGAEAEAAEKVEAATGLRVQILGGKFVTSPTPRGKHAGVVKQLRRQLEAAALPDGLDVYEVSSIALPDDPDDYATPDLIVLPLEWEEDDDWLADAADAALAVEVISQSEKSRDIRDKADWYAVARVPFSSSSTPGRAPGLCTPTRTTVPTAMCCRASSGRGRARR